MAKGDNQTPNSADQFKALLAEIGSLREETLHLRDEAKSALEETKKIVEALQLILKDAQGHRNAMAEHVQSTRNIYRNISDQAEELVSGVREAVRRLGGETQTLTVPPLIGDVSPEMLADALRGICLSIGHAPHSIPAVRALLVNLETSAGTKSEGDK